MTAIADRADVGKPALYRRYPTKAHLAFAAGIRGSAPVELPDLGSLDADLVPALEALVASLADVPRAVFADQIAAAITDAAFARRVQIEDAAPALDRIETLWRRAVARGEVAADIDGRAALDGLAGAVIFDVLVRHRPLDRPELQRIARRFVHGVSPTGQHRS